MIGIIDYKMGNIQSVINAFEFLGTGIKVLTNSSDFELVDRIVLPGVGAFGEGMNNLKALNLIGPLNEAVIDKKKPFLGICLGMQLLCKESFEFGHFQGLGYIDASVKKFPDNAGLRIPHIGWNDIKIKRPNKLINKELDGSNVYFVHSFYVDSPDAEFSAATCEYGLEFVAVLEKGNIMGTQFHPEKSQGVGIQILKNFIASQ